MAALLKSATLLVLTPECFDEFFVNFNFFDVPCLKAAISKALGLAIISGSIMVKVPQILKITANKSAAGLSIISILLDLFAITSNLSYSYVKGFPFSAWGEGLFLAFQTAVIASLVVHYNASREKAFAFMAAYLGVVYALMGGLTPVDVLWSMQALNVPILVTGKSMQAWANYSNGSTGQLSAATVFMLTFGSTARIFTSIQETGDLIIILTYLCATAVNLIIAGQVVYYWNVKQVAEKKTN